MNCISWRKYPTTSNKKIYLLKTMIKAFVQIACNKLILNNLNHTTKPLQVAKVAYIYKPPI